MTAFPAHGAVDWDAEIQAWLEVSHNSDGTEKSSGGGFPASALQAYVDYTNGSDSNNGLSPSSAFKTIQAAYNALKTTAAADYTAANGGVHGVGRIHLLPGDHDVGAGLSLDGNPVEIYGTLSGRRRPDTENFASRIVSSSSSMTNLVSCGSSGITYGYRFQDIAFVYDISTNTAFVNCIATTSVDHLEVRDCLFCTADDSQSGAAVHAIYQTVNSSPNNDSAWARIERNNVLGMGLYMCDTGANFNRSVIRDNACFYDGTDPMVYFKGDFQAGLVEGNNLEGGGTGVYMASNAADHNLLIANWGEDHTTSNRAFYQFAGSCNQNIIVGGYCAAPSVTGTFVTFASGATSNLVIANCDLVGASGFKTKFVDNNATQKNFLMSPGFGSRNLFKTGSATTISDSDFPSGSNTPNGTVGATWDTGTSAGKLWVKVNGTWKSAALS